LLRAGDGSRSAKKEADLSSGFFFFFTLRLSTGRLHLFPAEKQDSQGRNESINLRHDGNHFCTERIWPGRFLHHNNSSPMKKLILFAMASTYTLSVLAQGTVAFVNRSNGGTTHVWLGTFNVQGNGLNDTPAGTYDYAAHGFHLIGTGPNGLFEAQHYFAQLLGAPGSNAAESTLLPGLPTTTFRTGAGAGDIALTTVTFNNIIPDAAAGTFEMVVWDNTSGLYPTWTQASVAWAQGIIFAGRSAPFVLQNIGGSTFVPPNLNPTMQSFGFGAPEPSTAALAGLGAALLIFRRRR
jgi:hypothetical protein